MIEDLSDLLSKSTRNIQLWIRRASNGDIVPPCKKFEDSAMMYQGVNVEGLEAYFWFAHIV